MPVLSYTVGAIFTIEDEASGVLNALSEQFSRLDEIITGTKENLATLASETFGGLQSGLNRLSEVLTSLDGRSKTFGETLTTAADTAGAAASRTAEQVDSIAAAYQRAAEAARGFAATTADTSMAGAGAAAAAGAAVGSALVPVERQRGNYGDQDSGPTINMPGRGQALLEGPDEAFGDSVAAGAAGGVVGGGGGGSGAGGKRSSAGGHSMLHGVMPLAEVVAGYEAEKTAMNEDNAIRQALIGMNINPDSAEGQADFARMRELAYGAARGTIFSEGKASMAMPEAAPVLGFSGQEGMEKFERTFPIALRLGELSQMRHKGALGSEAVAGEEFAHLTDQYDPAGLEKELDLVNAIAKRGDTSIARQLSIMKYGLPVAMAAGIDPNRAAAEMGASEQILGPTSTVGTGYSQMLLSVLHSGGGINSHLAKSSRDSAQRAEHEFENALKLKPEELADYKSHAVGSKHDQAMAAFGFSEASVAEAHKAGNLDQLIESSVEKYAAHHDDAFSKLIDLMGVRGARYAEHYMAPDALARQQRYISGVQGALPVRAEQETLSHGPLQQFEQMLANLSNIGNTLATATLPGLNTAFRTLNVALSATNDFLKNHQLAAEAGGYGMLGLTGLALLGGAGKVLGGVGSLVRGGAGMVSGAAGAVTSGAASTVGGLGVLGLTAYAAHKALEESSDWLTDEIFGQGTAERRRKELDQAAPSLLNLLGINEAHSAEHKLAPGGGALTPLPGPRATTPAAPAGPPQITIHLGPVTMNGVADESTFHNLLSKLTDAVKTALSHASGVGQGTDLSPYVFGGF